MAYPKTEITEHLAWVRERIDLWERTEPERDSLPTYRACAAELQALLDDPDYDES